MSYLTLAHVQDRLRKNYAVLYTERGEDAADETIVAEDIEAAEADIHSYLAGRYTVPVTDAEACKLLKHWALVLLQEIAYGAIPGREVPKNLAAQVTGLRARLQKIADGELSLGTATEIPAAEAGIAGEFIADGPAPVFERDNMKGF